MESTRKTATDKCIVLDLDLTLVHTQEDMQYVSQCNSSKKDELVASGYNLRFPDPQGSDYKYSMIGMLRPGAREFIDFCFSYFSVVVVWSAGKKEYVYDLVDELFRDKKPHIVLTYDDIDFLDDRVLKRLSKLHAMLPRRIRRDNTLALDDNPDTFRDNVDNAVLIPPFEANLVGNSRSVFYSQSDNHLERFTNWLKDPSISSCTDVSILDKEKIFTWQ